MASGVSGIDRYSGLELFILVVYGFRGFRDRYLPLELFILVVYGFRGFRDSDLLNSSDLRNRSLEIEDDILPADPFLK